MANPIADTAQYFRRRQEQAARPQVTESTTPFRYSDGDGYSPMASRTDQGWYEDRGGSLDFYTTRSRALPLSTWDRVVARLAAPSTRDDDENSLLATSSPLPPTHSQGSTPAVEAAVTTSGDTRDLIRAWKTRIQHHWQPEAEIAITTTSSSLDASTTDVDTPPLYTKAMMPAFNQEEDDLPSMQEWIGRRHLEQAFVSVDDDDDDGNYFMHPFASDDDDDKCQLPAQQDPQPASRMTADVEIMPIMAPPLDHQDRDETSMPAEPAPAVIKKSSRYHIIPIDTMPEFAPVLDSAPPSTIDSVPKTPWERTRDKVRLISSIQPGRPSSQVDTTNTNAPVLVPYYPPAFDPIFIALSRDEHGNKLPPILLPLLNASVTDSEFLPGQNQWAFRIELQYGDIKWVIYRTIADFVMLHYLLKIKSSLLGNVPAPPPFPNQLQSLYDTCITTIGWDRKEDEQRPSLETTATPTDASPHSQPNHDSEDQYMDEKRDALERRTALSRYLQQLLQLAHRQISYDLCEFLELSAISMVQDMGWKGKEGYLQQRNHFVQHRCCQWITSRLWKTQWVLLRDSYIAFCDDIAASSPTAVLMLDKGFTMHATKPNLLGNYHLILSNQTRRIQLKGNKRDLDEWWAQIKKVQQGSPWIRQHRFNSFAPVRRHAKVKWFVDAENHFNAVAEAILSAKAEIYIADWWLTPELYLRRPPHENEDFRLDRLLKRKAEEGVMIYIIVYKEMSLALTIDSAHTKQWLQGLHPNIKVQRHPDHASIDNNNVLFWSHHEKIVVVDNRLAFIGGLDLCFGRYDSHQHTLSDHNPLEPAKVNFPGQDYSNPRHKDFVNVAQHDLTLVDRTACPRMPWHDVTLATVGPVARDIARHFIQRWNFIKSTKAMHRHSLPFLMPKGEYVAARDESKFKGSCRVQVLRSSSEWSSGVKREHSIYNAYIECISQSKHFIYIENQFFISATEDDKILRNKIAQALVERIIRAHEERETFKVIFVLPLVPAFEGDLASSEAGSARTVMHFQYATICRGEGSIVERLRQAGIIPSDYIAWYSLRNWGSIRTEDMDILSPDQYVTEILYIHDKIMIVDDRIALIGSANINDRSQLGNRDSEIAMIIEDTEMVDAYMDGQPYKAGKFAHTLRLQLWKEHLGLLDVEDWSSLLDADTVQDNMDVVIGKLEVLARQQCDDTNDSTSITTSTTAAQATAYLAVDNAKDIETLELEEPVRMIDRMSRSRSLYDTTRGTQSQDHEACARVLDPLCCFQDLWDRTAVHNTLIYRQLFHCVPDDTIHTFEQHRQFVNSAERRYGHVINPLLSGPEIHVKLVGIHGHLVQFPLDYLKNETLMGSNLIDSVTPMVIFT